MKVDAPLTMDLAAAGAEAARLEALGYDGLRVAELNHDPFLALTIAAEHTGRVELVTSVAVAFARNPMSTALLAHDLNAFSGGRLVLGLGSQVRAHIERRFGMPWHGAARQMREYLAALRAIFDCWYSGQRLEFVGEYYRHTLMPATFTPDNVSGSPPRIVLSAPGPRMTRRAAAAPDGIILHPFTSEKYLSEVTLPAIDEGLAAAGRSRSDFEIDYAPIVATGHDSGAIARAVAAARDRIAFYGSTAAYRPVLAAHGWGELQGELNALNKRRERARMEALIDDEVLHTLAIVGEPEAVVDRILTRFGGLIARTGLYVPGLPEEEQRRLLARLQAGDP